MFTNLVVGIVLIIACGMAAILFISGIRLEPWVIVPLFLFLKIAWPSKKRQPSSLDDEEDYK